MFHNPFVLIGTFALVVAILSALSTFGAAWLADFMWERSDEAKRSRYWIERNRAIRAFDPVI